MSQGYSQEKRKIYVDAMDEALLTPEDGKRQKRVRFRVASGNSGRVLKEMFKDEGPSDSLDSDCTSSSEADRTSTPSTSGEANGHLCRFLGSELDDSGSEPDDLLMFAGGRDKLLRTKRVNILSKNGTPDLFSQALARQTSCPAEQDHCTIKD
uniref:Glutaredoxin and cysteine rich domain containing 1 a n=1 Tax=Sinocyclocheilus grahami TaxID=75366 RepID=A0A672K5L3_SINGR